MENKSQRGLLIANYGNTLIVQSQEGTLIPCHMRQKMGTLVAGDEVEWEIVDEEKGVVTALLPRRSLLARADKQGEKPFAANLDQMMIMFAITPTPHPTTLDRYLILAEHFQINPLIVLNKIDLASQQGEAFQLIELYRELGYSVFPISVKTHQGLSELTSALQHHRTIAVGQSGVGKSSLLKFLIPDALIRIQSLSLKTNTGQQTTSSTTLYHLPQGGDLIDSPGIHQFNLRHFSPSAILHGYREFLPYLNQCKFINCEHKHEPGCALLAAVESGKISKNR